MNNSIERIKAEISKQEEKIEILEEKKSEILKSISEAKAKLGSLKKDLNNEKLKYFAKLAISNEVSVDDLIDAVQNKDFSIVQELLSEKKEESTKQEIEAEAENNDLI